MAETKIILVDGYHGSSYNFHLCKELESLKLNAKIATPNTWLNELYNKNGIQTLLIKSKVLHQFSFSKKKLIAELQAKGISDPISFVRTEKAYYGFNNVYLLNICLGYFSSIENLIQIEKPKLILQNHGGEIHRRITAMLCKNYNIKLVYPGESFLPDKITLYEDEYKKPILEPKGDLTLNLQKTLSDKLEKKPIMKYDSELNLPEYNQLKKFYLLIFRFNYPVILTLIAHKIKTTLGAKIRSFFQFLIYKPVAPNFSLKFFYYPLNVPAESELFIRNIDFSDQIEAVSKIANDLPGDTVLFIKQHPGKEGLLSINEISRLKAVKNCRLINTNTSSYDLIENAEAVIISSSSVGFESYLLKKPTIVLGNWPYTHLADFIKVNNLNQLREKLENLNDFSIKISPVNFLKNIELRSYPGTIYNNLSNLSLFAKTLAHIAEKVSIDNDKK